MTLDRPIMVGKGNTMADGAKMARSEAARKADQRYKAEKTRQMVVRFYPADADILEHLQSQDSKQGYIKRLIREDMARGKE